MICTGFFLHPDTHQEMLAHAQWGWSLSLPNCCTPSISTLVREFGGSCGAVSKIRRKKNWWLQNDRRSPRFEHSRCVFVQFETPSVAISHWSKPSTAFQSNETNEWYSRSFLTVYLLRGFRRESTRPQCRSYNTSNFHIFLCPFVAVTSRYTNSLPFLMFRPAKVVFAPFSHVRYAYQALMQGPSLALSSVPLVYVQ